jgi:hypothetical protein
VEHRENRASQFSNLCGKIETENHWEEGTMGGIKSLKAYIEKIPDFRRRQGRIYPLTGLLMMLILAAVNGESSLRGMLIWAQKNWEKICWGLGMGWLPHPPAYGTVWRILNLLEISKLEEALSQWAKGANVEAICIDEKSLRGSKRKGGLPALQVVVALGQGIKLVLGREGVDEEKTTEAALHLLKGIPIEGKVVTMDAGLNGKGIAKAIVEKGGPIWG